MGDWHPDLLSSTDLAGVLGIHPVSARVLIRRGDLPAVKVANRWLVDRSAAEEFARTYRRIRGWPPGRPRRALP